ncbi:MAG: hypothetical protein PF489_16245 [Salinivirgaceae bacterium]|jgi:hypothetical protein|nr:hypothetical protein [Salinivirgaceae bacterium]
MRRLFFIGWVTVLLISGFSGWSQNTSEWKSKLYGFVRADAFYDSRKSAEAVDGMLLLYPLNTLYDSVGNDINNIDQVTMTSISSRIGLKTGGGKIFNSSAIVQARLEADFTARSNSNSLRMRHAYVQLKWENHKLLMGRTWHPMFTPDVFPYTLSINVGAPFNPFNRSPQLRYTATIKRFSLLAALLYQNDALNLGPDSNNEIVKRLDLMRNSMIPNIHLQVKYSTELTAIGLFADFKSLRPRNFTTGIVGLFKTNNTIESLSTGIYGKVTTGKFCLKAKTMLGQNLTDHLMLGGYAVHKLDAATGEEIYTASNHSFSWLNFEYGKTFTGGLLIGYSHNLGFSNNIVPITNIYARGSDIEYLYRVSPYVKWQSERVELWAETEITTAAYGDIDYNHRGRVQNSSEVTNVRVQFSCVYLIM